MILMVIFLYLHYYKVNTKNKKVEFYISKQVKTLKIEISVIFCFEQIKKKINDFVIFTCRILNNEIAVY